VTETVKMIVPDLGEFSDVEVIEVLVSAGDTFEIEDGLVTVETDKASMDIPATVVGTVVSVEVAVGDKLNSGDVVAIIKPAMDGNADVAAEADDMRSTRVMSPEEIKMATQGIAAAEKFAEKLTEKLTDTSAAKPSEAAVQ
jgi:pyruvate dehydrogenase E2 component (dihydrolipoamide acetyltransferase)